MFSEELFDFIMENEGFRDRPYTCTAGRLTIGYGHNLDIPITEKTARAILRDDIGRAVRDLCGIFNNGLAFPAPQRMALIDMMLNLGLTRFLGFRRMIAAIDKGDWDMAAAEAKDSLWYTQVGVRGDKVVKLLGTKGEAV